MSLILYLLLFGAGFLAGGFYASWYMRQNRLKMNPLSKSPFWLAVWHERNKEIYEPKVWGDDGKWIH